MYMSKLLITVFELQSLRNRSKDGILTIHKASCKDCTNILRSKDEAQAVL